MVFDKGVRVTNCPMGQKYCYPFCCRWVNNRCSYDAHCRKELEDLRAMRGASRLYLPEKRR